MKPLERTPRLQSRPPGWGSLVVMATTLGSVIACDRETDPLRAGASEIRSSAPAAGAYVLDPDHSFIYFSAQHMVVGRVRGRFNAMTGTALAATDLASSKVDVVIESASVDTQNDLRDAELRGADFFDVKAFPTIEYHGRSFRGSGEKWIVDGALTIHGVTRSVPLDLLFKGTAPRQEGLPGRMAIHATAAVRRADFGMTRGLLDEIGLVSANPDVWIEIDAEFLAHERSSVSRAPAPRPKSNTRR